MVIKCKMCGGELNITEESNICECEFCGTQQTVPLIDNEKKVNLFNRANKLRMNADFDKAATVYASITAEFPEEAEAYWGLCLCKYGIEYVDDPLTGKKIPTCHRTLTEGIMDDSDFDLACENADPVAMRMYREEAKAIDQLQQNILGIVASEPPCDVFICYKETDENGERTEDSVLAQDIYDSLTGKGLKVFFSRISLEDKLGREYEPYIYAALHSSRVMLAVGTKFEYYNAVWVKNEWARFLDMMRSEKGKALIPCYRDIDAYDMPKEFKNFQGQDMAKLGWLQDLTRGVMKLCGKDGSSAKAGSAAPAAAGASGPTVDSLINRGFAFLEDEEWDSAREYADKVLDMDINSGKAYLIKLMADIEAPTMEKLRQWPEPIESHTMYQKIMRYGSDTDKQEAREINEAIMNGVAAEKLAAWAKKFEAVKRTMDSAKDAQDINTVMEALEETAKDAFRSQDAEEAWRTLEVCREKLEQIQKREKTDDLISEKEKEVSRESARHRNLLLQYESARTELSGITARLGKSRTELNNLHGLFSAKRRKELEEEIAKLQELEASAREKEKKLQWDVQNDTAEKEKRYQIAELYCQAGEYGKAAEEYQKIKGYKDADEKLQNDETLAGAAVQRQKAEPFRKIGNLVQFGRFSGDEDGSEAVPIDWMVLEATDRKALLITLYALRKERFNENRKGQASWESSDIRAWLNGEFYQKAFSPDEQKSILLTNINNSALQGYRDYPKRDEAYTQDSVFLLSCAETVRNMKTGMERRCMETPRSSYKYFCSWWLRSPGRYDQSVSTISGEGLIASADEDKVCGVRPAIWIDLESGKL
ncbi:MAG: DUF6273 domain-containing protein [Clostridiales bacterium]|nr:DUF6273 domain-containing protein [Clostridiales bacterium]